jgi:urease accessory protein
LKEVMEEHTLNWLRLMQIADSALPIGTLSHSYGLETLVQEGSLSVDNLHLFLQDYLLETGSVEAAFCIAACRIGERDDVVDSPPNPQPLSPTQAEGKGRPMGILEKPLALRERDACTQARGEGWLHINHQLDALKLARESREASATLGRRFLQLALKLDANPIFEQALQVAKSNHVGTHYCAAFGLVCGVWAIEPELAAASFLQQSITGLISACQRLMPLGQTQASRLIWDLKPTILKVAQHSIQMEIPPMFTAAVEVASMRHPDLATRLFIS